MSYALYIWQSQSVQIGSGFNINIMEKYGDHVITKYVLYIVVGYLFFCALLFVFQRKMLYLPDNRRLSEELAAAIGLKHWPSPDNFKGFVWHKASSNVNGTIIIFHGNAGAAYDRVFYAEALSRCGMRVILAEYPGYGSRGDQPSEQSLVDDALETIDTAFKKYDEPLYVWGESLGAGVVCAILKKTETPIKGVVLFLPWDSLPDVAQTHYWYLPARWLVLDKYNSIDNIRGFKGNVAVILAEDDEVIPAKHGKRLYDSIMDANKNLWIFKGATHNNMPLDPELKWWKEVVMFISSPDNV